MTLQKTALALMMQWIHAATSICYVQLVPVQHVIMDISLTAIQTCKALASKLSPGNEKES